MMFDTTSGRGFGGTINYDLDRNGRHDKDARILAAEGVDVYYNAEGILTADPRQLARSFRVQTMMNPDVKRCVKHLWISYMPEDQLVMVNNYMKGEHHFNSLDDAIDALGEQRVKDITDAAMIEDAKRLLQGLKYGQTQFLIVRHSEKDNPHVHVILNMVDNNGIRLYDFQDKKRGQKLCRQITEEKDYSWGQHKSESETVSKNPRENAHADICKEMFEITNTFETAEEMQREALSRDIGVKFLTDVMTGCITGISYSKDDYLFPASKIDASLSAKKLFPDQEVSMVPFSKLSREEQNIVKSGGVVQGFNNQLLHGAVAPEIPQSVQECRTRDIYHKAIEQADKCGSRTAYMLNIAGLALDPKCGPPEKRAWDIAPYIIDEQTNQGADVNHILEVVHEADEQALQQMSLFKLFIDFLSGLKDRLLNLKKYPIIAEKGREKIRWSDVRGGVSGEVVGLARNVQASIEEAHNSVLDKQARMQKEGRDEARHQTPAQGNDHPQKPQSSDPTKKSAGEEVKISSRKLKI